MPARITDEREKELAALYENHTSIKSLMQETGHGQRVICRAILKYGSPRASKVGRNTTDLFKTLNSESAYWLGFIAADGHIRFQPGEYRYELVVEVNQKDEAHLDKLRKFIGFGSKTRRTRDECVIFCFSSKQLVENLMIWLNPNNKTHLNNFSKIPARRKKDFVRGYFDGDGSKSANRFSITSCPETLFPLVDYISDEIGESPRVYRKSGQQAYVAWWNKAATHRFVEIFNGKIRLERKWT
jgi:intein/homing endonuclease